MTNGQKYEILKKYAEESHGLATRYDMVAYSIGRFNQVDKEILSIISALFLRGYIKA